MSEIIKFLKNVKKTAVEIFIYEDIGGDWLGGISAKQFADELKAAGNVDTIHLYLNSSGGNVMDGLAIFNTLKRHKARKIVDIDGFAVSIASIVAMAGDDIRMAQNGMMMIHRPWIVTSGNAEELREQAAIMDKIKRNLVKTYADQTGKEESEISDMMDAETWMTAQEALDHGFIHKITVEQKIAAYADLSRFHNAPEYFKNIVIRAQSRPKKKNSMQYRQEFYRRRLKALQAVTK